MYWYLDASGNILYVGKAKNLKNRLKSYTRLNALLPRTRKLIETATQTKFQILETELDAVLVEAELIRLHQPPFNVREKDDKSPLYIAITKEEFPRVLQIRRTELHAKSGNFKRIFGPFTSAYEVRRVLKLIRRIFPFCNATAADKKHHKACFYTHLNLCPGACQGTITAAEYSKIISKIRLFLSGKRRLLLKQLKAGVEIAAKKQDFESALRLKSEHDAVLHITHQYQGREESPLPNLSDDVNENRLMHLKQLLVPHLNIPKTHRLQRIEAYDVSNLQGTNPAVSMVVCTNGTSDKSQYRHFKIRSLNTPNDVAMLAEAITRRQNHPEWGIPDLLVIDGGKGQVNRVKKVLRWNIPIVGIAKDPDRLVIPRFDGSYVLIPLTPDLPAAAIIIGLRNEAHRFAKRLHSLNRSKL